MVEEKEGREDGGGAVAGVEGKKKAISNQTITYSGFCTEFFNQVIAQDMPELVVVMPNLLLSEGVEQDPHHTTLVEGLYLLSHLPNLYR
ncbi:MAG: hypothetical protein CBC65_000460 [Rhodothermaceae bacterium TMED105]|nr:MAG: hypothetical protein CBC65_000460 [Rhodothermaceae bacterium TMED105]